MATDMIEVKQPGPVCSAAPVDCAVAAEPVALLVAVATPAVPLLLLLVGPPPDVSLTRLVPLTREPAIDFAPGGGICEPSLFVLLADPPLRLVGWFVLPLIQYGELNRDAPPPEEEEELLNAMLATRLQRKVASVIISGVHQRRQSAAS